MAQSTQSVVTLQVGDRVRYKGPIVGVVEAVWTPKYGYRQERPQARVRFPRGVKTARADAFRKVEAPAPGAFSLDTVSCPECRVSVPRGQESVHEHVR